MGMRAYTSFTLIFFFFWLANLYDFFFGGDELNLDVLVYPVC